MALTRPKVLYALIRALAVAIATAISFGFGLPNADWMPIATIVAMKPSLDQAEFVAVQRLAGAGDDDQELRCYLEAIALLGDDLMGGMVDELLSETVRALVRRGRRPDAEHHLDALRRVAPGRPNAEGFLWWAEGVAQRDPAKLRAAAERFAELTRPIDEGRVLLDLAVVGDDAEANRARARELFAKCGAEVYVRRAAGADEA